MQQAVETRFDEQILLLMNAADVAARLRISKRYAYQLMATGVIPTVRIGRAVRVMPDDFRAFVAQLQRDGLAARERE